MGASLDPFTNWMRKNTTLAESSIRQYARTIARYQERYGEALKLEHINEFVTEGFRDNHSIQLKFAFRAFCKYKNKMALYKQVVGVKIPPRKKTGKHLPEHLVLKIIQTIQEEKYADIAKIQYSTAARARGIITLKEENIDFDFSDKAIRLRMIEKGGKERFAFLRQEFRELLEKYLRPGKGYLFLPETARRADDEDLERTIDTERSYYYAAVRDAAQEQGVQGFGTHDFRRNVAQMVKKKYKDPFIVKKVLGHANISTTLRYFDESPEEVEKVLLDHQGENHESD